MGLTVVPSDANFVMVVLDDDAMARDLVEGLLRRGITIRPLESLGLPNCVRISTGTPTRMENMCRGVSERLAGSIPLSQETAHSRFNSCL